MSNQLLMLPAPLITARDVHTRNYLEPIGPATNSIDLLEFSDSASDILAKSMRITDELDIKYGRVDAEQPTEFQTRCSLDDITAEVAKIYEEKAMFLELKSWHQDKMYPVGHTADPEEEGMVDQETATVEHRKRKLDADVVALIAEADQSRLGITKRIQDQHHFLRKAKATDYNTLSTIRSSSATVPQALPETDLSNVILTLTFQAVPRFANKQFTYPRVQTLVVLGSTTLYELRENIMVGGDAIPAEMEDSEGEKGDEEEDYQVHFGGTKRKKWSEERRVTGSVWGINGVLYPDIEEGKIDYAEMIVDLIDEINWVKTKPKKSGAAATRLPPGVPLNYAAPKKLTGDIEVGPAESPTPELSDDGRTGNEHKPNWTMGSAMQETRVGELGLKIGEPYWFMHQGNCEHVWSIDSIRHIHPLDPVPTSSKSSHPYPITTFLSRLTAPAKCKICDRDPGTIITIDDELAGESPCLMCTICFEMMHGANEDGHVEVISFLPEY